MATQPDVGTQSATSVGPDWASINEEILCPLCNYNLRGLIEPRCPECGYRFAWPDLLDPRRGWHPWLFEHHPERNIWSGWMTWKAALRPVRFWTSLSPVQPSRPRRLIAYWCITVVCLLFLLICPAGPAVLSRARANTAANASSRTMSLAYFNSPRGAEQKKRIEARYGSTQAYLNLMYPTAPDYNRAAWHVGYQLMRTTPFLLALVFWPWLTIICLLVFQATMRRRRVRAIHVVRTAIYNQDILILMVIPIGMSLSGAGTLWGFGFRSGTFVADKVLLAALCVGSVFIYRMCAAYKHYLQFDRPFLTVLASQAIAGLVVVNLLMIPLVWR